MSDSKEWDQAVKGAMKLIDEWGDKIEKVAAELKKLDAGKDGGKDGKDGKDGDKKAGPRKDQDEAAKKAQEISDKLQESLKKLKLPQPPDPKQGLKLPDLLTKHISKNGVKLGDYGSVKPDLDIDLKKMQLKKVGVVWSWEW